MDLAKAVAGLTLTAGEQAQVREALLGLLAHEADTTLVRRLALGGGWGFGDFSIFLVIFHRTCRVTPRRMVSRPCRGDSRKACSRVAIMIGTDLSG
jgi:hypothetical protein